MKIRAHVHNSFEQHQVMLTTNGQSQAIQIAPKSTGFGSSVNGGELLFLALATCYCNDIYREAEKLGIRVDSVDVEVDGEFGGPGEPAQNVTYDARVTAQTSEEDILTLMKHTDLVAEIQNTLRAVTPVVLSRVEAVSIQS